jgi:hypothetical protein
MQVLSSAWPGFVSMPGDRPPRPRLSLKDRLLRKVEHREGSDCWLWTGQIDKGYARVQIKHKWLRVHRLTYELFVGPIAPGMEIDHTCHTNDPTCAGGFTCLHRRCVNPAHLEQVTRLENRRRRDRQAVSP